MSHTLQIDYTKLAGKNAKVLFHKNLRAIMHKK